MARSSPQVLTALPAPIVAIEQELELVPIPAAHIARRAGRLMLTATNQLYRLAALGTTPATSPMLLALGDRIREFLDSVDSRSEFAWQLGEVVDCRHYQVTLARSIAAPGDDCHVYFVDLTGQRRTEQSLRREMTTDALTGLPNRQGLGDLFEADVAALAMRAVIVVDLNRFGRLNACLGDMAGDELLITVARRIRGALRIGDTLARIGGDEFGIVLEVADPEEARHAAKRIERVLSEPFRLTDYEIGVEGSIGIAFGDAEAGSGCDIEELIRHAQFAVKRAKASGRPEVYQNHAFIIQRQQFALETMLRRAIEERELRLAYQPICDLETGRMVAVEALARWFNEAGEEVPPGDFISVAEESGLIVPLGRWAIEEATSTLASWDERAGRPCGVNVAVNLSPIQLQRDALVAVVERALTKTGLRGDRLKLELTESALVTDPEHVAGIMRSLKELGTRLAMDDFGTGYSNLAFLQQLPIDLLKIDRSFVTGMLADRDKAAIVRAILGLAQALGMKTIAEGVETYELAQTLAAMGCSMGQGFFYARPLEAEDAWSMIEASLAKE